MRASIIYLRPTITHGLNRVDLHLPPMCIRFVVSGEHYKDFAMTSVNKRGYRILVCPLGYTYSQHVSSQNGTWWRCNTSVVDKNGKSKRCGQRIKTKLSSSGYEMIEMVKQHGHKAKPPPLNQVLGQNGFDRC